MSEVIEFGSRNAEVGVLKKSSDQLYRFPALILRPLIFIFFYQP